jgi:hypothetical protein
MIEYLYDAIRATGGEDIVVSAAITDVNNTPISSGCTFTLFDDKREIYHIDGEYYPENGEWQFVLPANATKDLPKGRYWYCVSYNSQGLNFKQPLYLI